jgi:hypothetical protein
VPDTDPAPLLQSAKLPFDAPLFLAQDRYYRGWKFSFDIVEDVDVRQVTRQVQGKEEIADELWFATDRVLWKHDLRTRRLLEIYPLPDHVRDGRSLRNIAFRPPEGATRRPEELCFEVPDCDDPDEARIYRLPYEALLSQQWDQREEIQDKDSDENPFRKKRSLYDPYVCDPQTQAAGELGWSQARIGDWNKSALSFQVGSSEYENHPLRQGKFLWDNVHSLEVDPSGRQVLLATDYGVWEYRFKGRRLQFVKIHHPPDWQAVRELRRDPTQSTRVLARCQEGHAQFYLSFENENWNPLFSRGNDGRSLDVERLFNVAEAGVGLLSWRFSRWDPEPELLFQKQSFLPHKVQQTSPYLGGLGVTPLKNLRELIADPPRKSVWVLTPQRLIQIHVDRVDFE